MDGWRKEESKQPVAASHKDTHQKQPLESLKPARNFDLQKFAGDRWLSSLLPPAADILCKELILTSTLDSKRAAKRTQHRSSICFEV
jgi:hypothetical protein